ncbi:hypothetical protein [Microbulbifer agarilyticus]|uniref:hypothetical protein n=1 Tax=Microbulbifer agarilyticus TaxID=260552 RepID=UPI001CD1B3AF|nr:hypothetical protein [Microbulbifer agarilyticus]MCA0894789.1 hypothetical protein [Microbulbifer agarilyticus]
MNVPYKSTALAAALAALVAMPMVWADDDVAPEANDVEVVETAEGVPSERIAGLFSDFFGEDSQAIVNGLRDGSIQYVEPTDVEGGTEDGETADVEAGDTPEMEDGAEATTGMGYGNVVITMALAEQLAGMSEAEVVEGEEGMIAQDSLNEILRMRQVEGMGWGQIAKAIGVNLGEVMSGIRSNRPERADQVERKAARAEKQEMREMARAERVAGKMEKMEKPARVEKVERPEKPQRPEKPERPERPGK